MKVNKNSVKFSYHAYHEIETPLAAKSLLTLDIIRSMVTYEQKSSSIFDYFTLGWEKCHRDGTALGSYSTGMGEVPQFSSIACAGVGEPSCWEGKVAISAVSEA